MSRLVLGAFAVVLLVAAAPRPAVATPATPAIPTTPAGGGSAPPATPAAPAARDEGGAVALLPLDADVRLELYGQPVASEIARALVVGGVDVVVVGPKMTVPERAAIIVDGTIAGAGRGGHGDAVTITVRVRDPHQGTVVATLTATAPSLGEIDRAAHELSADLLPAVQAQLAAVRAARAARAARPPPVERPAPPVDRVAVAAPPRPTVLLALVAPAAPASGGASPADAHRAALRTALASASAAWLDRHGRMATAIPATTLAGKATAVGVVLGQRGAELALTLDVRAFSVEGGAGATAVPLGRARVRVRVVASTGVVFDRVVVTDTVVGDRGLPEPALATRAAEQVLAIVAPHLARAVAGWR